MCDWCRREARTFVRGGPCRLPGPSSVVRSRNQERSEARHSSDRVLSAETALTLGRELAGATGRAFYLRCGRHPPADVELHPASPWAASSTLVRAMTAEDHINLAVPPSGTGCAECLESGGWWFHLRRCASCGHIGCCDQSPSQHTSRHANETGHPIIRSFEPGEDWYFDYRTGVYGEGLDLAPPTHYPLDQPAPGPAGRVPVDWQSRLH